MAMEALAIVDTLIITRKMCTCAVYCDGNAYYKVGQCVSNLSSLCYRSQHEVHYTSTNQKHHVALGKGLSTHLLCTHGMELRVEHISSQW